MEISEPKLFVGDELVDGLVDHVGILHLLLLDQIVVAWLLLSIRKVSVVIKFLILPAVFLNLLYLVIPEIDGICSLITFKISDLIWVVLLFKVVCENSVQVALVDDLL